MYSIYLSHAILTHPEHYNAVAPHIPDLKRAAQCLSELNEPDLLKMEPGGWLLRTIVYYAKKYGKLPDRKGVTDAANELLSKGADSSWGEKVEEQLVLMDEVIADAAKPPKQDVPTDIDVLIESTIGATRMLWHQQNGALYARRARGVEISDGRGGFRKSTPDDAIEWMRKQWTKDLQKYAPRPAGFLDENTEVVVAELERMKTADENDRVRTGFIHIDDCLVLSKKLRPFIGIMGFANDGKTTVLRTMLYNMAMDGKTVLLFSKEHDPLEEWMSFAFLHSYHYKDEFTLPSLTDFQKHTASEEDWANLFHIIDDIKARKNITGRIEVERLTDWDALTSHLKANHKLVKYDVVAVDYLTRIDIPWGKPQTKNQDMATQIGMVQALTRDFNDGEGIIFITPIQINRSGYQQAKKKEEGEKRHDLTSVQQHSEFYQDMDFIISIFRDDLMKLGDTLLMEVQKVRGAAFPPTAALAIDPFSRKVVAPGDARLADKHVQDYVDGKTQTPVTKYMREEVIQQSIYEALDS